jgi:hypothetical protein
MHSAATGTAFVINHNMHMKSKASVARGTKKRPAAAAAAAACPNASDSTDTEVSNDNDRHQDEEELLSCRILGFYPFPTPPPQGPLGWVFRDTHQAIMVQSSSPSSSSAKGRRVSVLMDFMTKDGEFHPVWYNEIVKWNVFLGGTIEGEVRVRFLGNKTKNDYQQQHDLEERCRKSPKMERLLKIARSYDCEMNLYGNNCRMFAARMEREVERLNYESNSNSNCERVTVEPGMAMDSTRIPVDTDATQGQAPSSEMAADFRCAVRILGAGMLPALYPLSALLFSYMGLHDLV